VTPNYVHTSVASSVVEIVQMNCLFSVARHALMVSMMIRLTLSLGGSTTTFMNVTYMVQLEGLPNVHNVPLYQWGEEQRKTQSPHLSVRCKGSPLVFSFVTFTQSLLLRNTVNTIG
jgi:hypothetical protein